MYAGLDNQRTPPTLSMEERTIPIEQFNAAFQAMGEIVRRHVLNAALEPEETLLAIENDWGAVTSGVQGESTPGSPS